MKNLLLIAVLTSFFTFSYGQKSIDALFDRYAGKDGFTTVTINGNLLSLADMFCDDENEKDQFPGKISVIRILTQEDTTLKVVNFYDLVMKDIDVKQYEEFMRVKESDQDLRILVRSEGKKLKEFLLIAGGDDNALIQIKGELSLEDAKRISEDVRKNNGVEKVAEHN
jgi:hypothetical protein